MPPSLLASQLATLEPPTADEHPITVDVAGQLAETVTRALAALAAA
jgi:gluconokinase